VTGRVLAAVALFGAAPAAAQDSVFVRDLGPGPAGRVLRTTLASPHSLLRADTVIALRRDAVFHGSVIVLGASATVASSVHGDVVVIGGDLFLRPGATIDGRAVAIGGGVYNSTLAVVRGGSASYRDITYVAVPTPTGLALDYRMLERRDLRPVVFPGLYGLRIPTYDRTDGAVVPAGPLVSLDTGRYEIEPAVTYRSDLGAVDPSLEARATLGRRFLVVARAGRFTLSNDRWINGDLVNSLATLAAGVDTRNYYRADRADVTAHRLWETATADVEPYVGVATERAWSVGPFETSTSRPWSLFGRDSRQRMLRPNPRVARGRISSAIAGATAHWESQQVLADGTLDLETPFAAPRGARFVQTTVDVDVGFPTFGDQRFVFGSHVVLTAGDTAPPQRFAYVGGSGTLPTFDLLEFGGDQLFYAHNEYIIPLDLVVPLLGAPELTVRYLIGGAHIGRFPTLEQNVGLRVAISVFRVEVLTDPASRTTKGGVSLSFFR
jgi:hypothetical protein